MFNVNKKSIFASLLLSTVAPVLFGMEPTQDCHVDEFHEQTCMLPASTTCTPSTVALTLPPPSLITERVSPENEHQKQAILAELEQSSVQENIAHLLATPTRSARAFKKSRYGADWLVPNFDNIAHDFEMLATKQVPEPREASSRWSYFKNIISHLRIPNLKSCLVVPTKRCLTVLRSCITGLWYGVSSLYDAGHVATRLLSLTYRYTSDENFRENIDDKLGELEKKFYELLKKAITSAPSTCQKLGIHAFTYVKTLCARTKTIITNHEALCPLMHAWQLSTGVVFITQQKYPIFYAFLHNIARKMNTTLPRHIIVFRLGVIPLCSPLRTIETTYNACAGPVHSLLVIGLPLIKNLSIKHLEAIIAHELSHQKYEHALSEILLARILPKKFLLFLCTRGHEKEADCSAAAILDRPETIGEALCEVTHMIPVIGPVMGSQPGLIFNFLTSFILLDNHPSLLERFHYTRYQSV